MIKILDFYADWCVPCKKLAPILEELQNEMQLTIEKINVELEPEKADDYAVRNIPTLLIYKDDILKATVVGTKTKASLLTLINNLNDAN